MTDPHTPDVRHLRRGGTSVVVDVAAPGCPVIAYWGPDLGELGADVLESLSRAQRPQRVSGGLDATPLPSVVPIPAQGWFGVPGLEGSRDGTAFSPALGVVDVRGDGTSLALAPSATTWPFSPDRSAPASAVGAGGSDTVTTSVSIDVFPWSSVTFSATVYDPAAPNVWTASTPVASASKFVPS